MQNSFKTTTVLYIYVYGGPNMKTCSIGHAYLQPFTLIMQVKCKVYLNFFQERHRDQPAAGDETEYDKKNSRNYRQTDIAPRRKTDECKLFRDADCKNSGSESPVYTACSCSQIWRAPHQRFKRAYPVPVDLGFQLMVLLSSIIRSRQAVERMNQESRG